jgi:hypothetical protein
MAIPLLTPDQTVQVFELVAQYITAQRGRYLPRALPLSAQLKGDMEGFFSPQLLDGARLLVLTGERVANPAFYPMLTNLGFNNLPDQSAMAAITFSDVVVSHGPFTAGLLFHELVHVEQYRQLGVQRLLPERVPRGRAQGSVADYTSFWLVNGRSYSGFTPGAPRDHGRVPP